MKRIKKSISMFKYIVMIVIVAIVLMIISVPLAFASDGQSIVNEATELAQSIEAWLLLFTPVLASGIGVGYGIYRVIARNVKKDRTEIKESNTNIVSNVKEIIRLANDSINAQNRLQGEIKALNEEIKTLSAKYNEVVLEKTRVHDFQDAVVEIVRTDIVGDIL